MMYDMRVLGGSGNIILSEVELKCFQKSFLHRGQGAHTGRLTLFPWDQELGCCMTRGRPSRLFPP